MESSLYMQGLMGDGVPEAYTDLQQSSTTDEDLPAGWLLYTDHRHGHEIQREFPLWEKEILRIGRDPRSNTFSIETDDENIVSRNHCEVYVIVYEPSVSHIYVRDRKSFNGTYVNGRCIGDLTKMSSGHLLDDGDAIEILPHWKFIFKQRSAPRTWLLSPLQLEECRMFAGNYEILPRTLGSGGQGVAHLAIDVATGKQLVCKLVNLETSARNRRATHQSLRQETDVLRQLQHPNILPYIEAFWSPHTLYTFTELAAGGDLISFIHRQEYISEFDCRIIVRQITRGLRFLHEKGIIHRDLKPENILLAYSPKIAYQRVMLADFGCCAVPKRSRLTTNTGTFQYQAPEIATRDPQTTVADIWSLGLVTLLLLTLCGNEVIANLPTDQFELRNCVHNILATRSDNCSTNAKLFLIGCLQVAPQKRMSSEEADTHPWLRTPLSHLKFFQEMDDRILADWQKERQLRPAPYELPDLLQSSLPTGVLQEIPAPNGQSNLPRSTTEKCSNAPTSVEKRRKPNIESIPVNKKMPRVIRVKSTSTSKGTASTKQRIERIKSRNIRVSDSLQLPLNSLDRHLNPEKPDRRAQVLQKLQENNAMFISQME